MGARPGVVPPGRRRGRLYLLSQYGPASARDVRALADEFGAFVGAFNDHVDSLGADLSRITLSDGS